MTVSKLKINVLIYRQPKFFGESFTDLHKPDNHSIKAKTAEERYEQRC